MIWAKKFVNGNPLYLIQWGDYAEMTWEPRANIPWRSIVDFERDNRKAVWVDQCTRGRRRPSHRVQLHIIIIYRSTRLHTPYP
jgi:hypothetical protein